jgi:hypothetical protein
MYENQRLLVSYYFLSFDYLAFLVRKVYSMNTGHARQRKARQDVKHAFGKGGLAREWWQTVVII